MMRQPEEIAAEMAALRGETEAAEASTRERLLALREEHAEAARAKWGAATCPRRMSEMGPWEFREGLDWWRPGANGERACSFCGSMHPEDFDRFVDRVIADPDPRIRLDVADRRHKLYVNRPEVRNSSEGPIKFYVAHAPADWTPEDSPAHAKLREALRISREKFSGMVYPYQAIAAEARAKAEGIPVAAPEVRCPMACPHGDRCRLEAGHAAHGFGCSHLVCSCNLPNVDTSAPPKA